MTNKIIMYGWLFILALVIAFVIGFLSGCATLQTGRRFDFELILTDELVEVMKDYDERKSNVYSYGEYIFVYVEFEGIRIEKVKSGVESHLVADMTLLKDDIQIYKKRMIQGSKVFFLDEYKNMMWFAFYLPVPQNTELGKYELRMMLRDRLGGMSYTKSVMFVVKSGTEI